MGARMFFVVTETFPSGRQKSEGTSIDSCFKDGYKNQIHLKKHGKSCKNSNVFEKRALAPLIITIIFFLHPIAD
jgi:hypothetical protein